MTAEPVEVVFPWEPCAVSVNQRTAFVGGSHRLSRAWRNGLDRAAQEAMLQTAGVKPDPETHYRAELACWLPDRRNRNLDNVVKLPLDALEGYVYEDDVQVRDIRVYAAGIDRENPRLVLTVEPLEGSKVDPSEART